MSIPALEALSAQTTEGFYSQLLINAEALTGGTSTNVTYLTGVWGHYANIAYGQSELAVTVFVPAIQAMIEACYGDTAAGTALDRYCKDIFDEEREQGAQATIPVVFTNTSAIPAPISAGDFVTIQNSITGALYKVFGPFTIPALGSTPAPGFPGALSAIADEVGTVGNAQAGELSIIVGSVLPPEITVNNPAAGFGQDIESDPDYLARSRLAWAPLSPAGPDDAYLASALNAKRPDGTNVDVTRAQVISDPITGTVTVYYASPTGPTADLAYVIDAAEREVRPNGVDYTGLSAIAVVVNIAATITIKASFGYTAPQIQTIGEDKMEDLFPTIPVGGELNLLTQYRLEQALGDALPQANPIVISAPAADVPLADGEVATLGTVTITTVFV